jgi:hypothetical protein
MIRSLLFGSIRIDAAPQSHSHGPRGVWFESGPEPIERAAADAESAAFVRVLLLRLGWPPKRSIRHRSPGDDERPKPQRPAVVVDRALAT